MKKLIGYFLQGLLYITPIAVTIYAIVFSFTWIDDLLRDLVIFQEGGLLENFSFPGLGIIIIVFVVTLIGFVGQRLISAPLISLVEAILDKAPVIKVIYTSVKDLMSAFVGKDRKFDQPVIVRLDTSNIIQRMGFITNSDLSEIGLPDKMSVYFPSSYGVLGELVIVPKENVTLIDANNTDVMKFIISGGVTKIK
jgi:uncharacterized membrane protein